MCSHETPVLGTHRCRKGDGTWDLGLGGAGDGVRGLWGDNVPLRVRQDWGVSTGQLSPTCRPVGLLRLGPR